MTTSSEQSNSGPGYARAPDHILSLVPAGTSFQAVLNGVVIAASDNAVILHESNHQDTVYFPAEDVRLDLASKTDHSTHCPFKGDASYWSFDGGENIAWGYETPFDEMIGIKNYVAFYNDRLDSPV